MYFKTPKDSETGKKFAIVDAKMDIAKREASAFASQFNCTQYYGQLWEAYGGIAGLVFPQGQEIPPVFKKVQGTDNGYTPRLSTKAGKEIKEEMDELTTVSKFELNSCIGYQEHFKATIGFFRSHAEFYLFEYGSDWGITAPTDCTEITESEYIQLQKTED